MQMLRMRRKHWIYGIDKEGMLGNMDSESKALAKK